MEDQYQTIVAELDKELLTMPNTALHKDVPIGKDETENVVVKAFGKIPEFNFEPKDHIELMTKLGMVDFDRGVKVHGFRGYFLLGDGARLSMAIWNYAMEFFSNRLDFNNIDSIQISSIF